MVQLSTLPSLDSTPPPEPSVKGGVRWEEPGEGPDWSLSKGPSPEEAGHYPDRNLRGPEGPSIQHFCLDVSTAYYGYDSYIEDGLICLKHKVRNLEKKKQKLDDYKKKMSRGEALNKDQLVAVEKYDEVLHNITFARELHKILDGLTQNLLKAQHKAMKKEQMAAADSERKHLTTVLQVQHLLGTLQQEQVQGDLLSGQNQAPHVPAHKLHSLKQLAALLGVQRNSRLSLEQHMEQAAAVYLDLLEGKDQPVAGSSFKLLKEELSRLLDCTYFNRLPSPPKRPEVERRSAGHSNILKSKAKELSKEYFIRPPAEGDAAPAHNWHEDFQTLRSCEPPDSWDLDFSDTPTTPQDPAHKCWRGKGVPVKKPQADCKQRKERKPKAEQNIKSMVGLDLPMEVFSSPRAFPEDPVLRKQHLEDLVTKIHGSFSFMQESLLDGESSPTNGHHRHKRWPSGSPSALAQPGKSPAEVQPGKSPAEVQPGKSPAEVQPGKSPAEVQPGKSPAEVQPGKSPAEVQPGKSPAGVQPVKSPAGVQPVKSPAGVQPVKSPAGVQPVKSPAGVQPVKSPAGVQPVKSPAGVQPVKSPAGVQPVKSPAEVQPGKSPAEVQPEPMHSTPLPARLLERKASFASGEQGLGTCDLKLLQKDLPHEPFRLSARKTFPSPPLYRRESNISINLDIKSRPQTPVYESEKLSPCNGVESCSSTPPQGQTFSTSPSRRSLTSTRFQTIQSVFNVNAAIPTKLKSKSDSVFSEPKNTVGTQTPPEFAPSEDEPQSVYQTDYLEDNSGQVILSPGQLSGRSRSDQLYYMRGSMRGGPYTPQAVGDTGALLYPARDQAYEQDYRRGGRHHSGANWNDSSQMSSPDRDGVFTILDSGLGDSMSVSTVEVPLTPHSHNQHTNLLSMQLYPLSQPMRVAFTASRTVNFAPGNLDQPIVFDQLHSNLGGMYDAHIGRFTCPVNGTYVFIFHILKLAVNVPLYINLMRNEEVMVSAYANDGAPDHETASNHAILPLFQGDQVWLRLHRGAIYGSTWKYSTFSGFLLYQD